MALAETQSLTASFLASEVSKRLPWERLLAEGGVVEAGEVSLRLSEADFLKAPPILREEAIFAGVDMLGTNTGENTKGRRKRPLWYVPVPRRAAVRRAAEQGPASAENLGPVRIQRRNGCIEMIRLPGSGSRGAAERGFSLLIKEAGFYTLKGRVLGKGNPALCIRAGVAGAENQPGVFSACFPIVFRNHRERDRIYKGGHRRRLSDILDREIRTGYTGIITAEDAEGPAAFVCFKRSGELLVISREAVGLGESFFFEVFGGLDV